MSNEIIQAEQTATNTLANSVFSLFPNGKRMTVYNAKNNSLSLKDDAPAEITLQGIMCEPGIRAVSGEPCINTYLVADDDRAYFTQSTGIGRCALDMLDMYERNVAGMVVRVSERALSGGRTLKTLEIISEPDGFEN